MSRYTHQELGKEIRSISGHYTITDEERLEYRGREILYTVGYAIIDNSCCGVGGCRFVNVPGYIISWKNTTGDSSYPVSEVEPITDKDEQQELKTLLTEKYPNAQINF